MKSKSYKPAHGGHPDPPYHWLTTLTPEHGTATIHQDLSDEQLKRIRKRFSQLLKPQA